MRVQAILLSSPKSKITRLLAGRKGITDHQTLFTKYQKDMLHQLLEDVLDKMAKVVVKSTEKSDSRDLLGSGVDGMEHAGHRRHQAN